MARSAVLPTHPSGPGCRHLMPTRLAPGVAPALLGAMTACLGVRSGAPGALYPPVKANKLPTLLHSQGLPKDPPQGLSLRGLDPHHDPKRGSRSHPHLRPYSCYNYY